jgi:manganese efflux pump family protein
MPNFGPVLGLNLVAVAVGLSNFAAAIGIGLSGVTVGVRIRVAIIFGIFEAGMPVAGLLIGHRIAGSFGSSASSVGGGLLIAIGIYSILWPD